MERQQGKKAHRVTKGRKVLVVKRKKVVPKKASGALPTFKKRRRPESTSTTAAASSSICASSVQTPEEDDPFDDVLASLPNDCALGIQSLQQNTQTSIAIPLPLDTSHYIRGVLELFLYRKMQDSSQGDTVVSRELAELLETNQIRKLSSPSRETNPLQVLLFASDYERAARNTMVDDTSTQAAEWMIRQLPYLTGQRIAVAVLQERWSTDKIVGTSLDRVLETLTRQQLLLFLPLEQCYQLWLPTWGVVLQAWETARKKALMNLKRSYYKERSMLAMQQKYSPIPTELLLDWMESVGQVELVDRPAGKFVRLPPEEDT